MSKQKLVVAGLAVALIAGGAYWYQVGAVPHKSEAKPAAAAAGATLVFTSPPRESAEDGELLYRPIAEYLSQALGKRVVYRHPGTWGVYRTEMLNGGYDIIFDGGHFVGYRALKLQHNVVAKMPEAQQFAIIVRSDDKSAKVTDLAGETFCSPPPPNQGALLALSQFPDSAKQPIMVPITSKFWPSVYEGVVGGRCKGGVLVFANWEKLDKSGATKVLFKTPPQPNQAFTVGPRVTPEDQSKIAAALTSAEAARATENLRERFKVGERFVAANNAEYLELAELLRNEWGFF
jgi:ABC-type phosphate/phosphonate transport system substrate-binding protein